MLKKALINIISFTFFFILSFKSFSQGIVEVKLDAIQDAFIPFFNQNNSSKGGVGKLKISSQSGREQNVLIKFKLDNTTIPTGAEIVSAKIMLHGKLVWQGDWNSVQLSAHTIKSNWDEKTVLWNNFGTNDYTAKASSVFPLNNNFNGWAEWDVKNDISNIIKYSAYNKGWFIKISGGFRKVYFTSSNNKTAKEFRPKLVITYKVKVEPITINTIEQNNVSSFGYNDGMAKIEPKGGSGNYTYNWFDIGSGFPNAYGDKKNHIKNLTAGEYRVVVFDALDNNFFKSHTVTITQPAPAVINIVSSSKQNVKTYGGKDGSATVNISGGTGNYTLKWNPEPTNGQGTNSISGLSAGTYSLLVTDASNNSFSKSFSVTLTEPSQTNLQNPPGVTISETIGATCDNSSILDIQSDEKGVLIPRITKSQRDLIPAPAQGLLVYIKDDNSFHFWNQTEWEKIGGTAKKGTEDISLQGETYISESLKIEETLTLTPTVSPPASPTAGVIYMHDNGDGTSTLKIWNGVEWKSAW